MHSPLAIFRTAWATAVSVDLEQWLKYKMLLCNCTTGCCLTRSSQMNSQVYKVAEDKFMSSFVVTLDYVFPCTQLAAFACWKLERRLILVRGQHLHPVWTVLWCKRKLVFNYHWLYRVVNCMLHTVINHIHLIIVKVPVHSHWSVTVAISNILLWPTIRWCSKKVTIIA